MPAWRLGLTALARKLPHDEIAAWLDGLKVRAGTRTRSRRRSPTAPTIANELEGNCLIAGRHRRDRASPHAPDAPLFALALTDLPQLHDYFERLAGIRLEITGADVAELGPGESPRVGEILAELRRRKLNGELDGRESELAAARELVEAG